MSTADHNEDEIVETTLLAMRDWPIDELRRAWRTRFGTPAPRLRSRELFVRAYACELERRRTGISLSALDKRISGLASRIDRGLEPSGSGGMPSPGSAIIRDWRGVRHVVLVTADGFIHEEKTYKSLSAIAKVITGTHWNGRRFFQTTAPEPKP